MPLYEYECEACGFRFEMIQRFSDAPIERCTSCGGAVHKLLSAPAIQFKGTGWYVTDYAGKKSGAPASDSPPASTSTGSSSSGSGSTAGGKETSTGSDASAGNSPKKD